MFKSVWKKGKKGGSVQGPFQFSLKEKEIKNIKRSSQFGRKEKKGGGGDRSGAFSVQLKGKRN